MQICFTNIRDSAKPPHFKVDDTPYGGGPGMVMNPEVLAEAIESARHRNPNAKVILLAASGLPFTQARAQTLCAETNLILICGRYEGIDQRVIDLLVDEELSIGDYVLMGGEVPAMVIIESVARLIDDVIGNAASLGSESFTAGLLEGPQYTRPPEFRGKKVPEVLLSGNHREIEAWRNKESLQRTKERRPDLLPSKGKKL